ncbi:helix-turn-helix domain-containing protein [Tamaricihabitans halophyticus]|nr:helix-turn-helix transcriptional regulator [Tamaricihabitans halophyticus]
MAGNNPKLGQLGSELRQAREAAGIGQREMARRLDVGASTVNRWEQGERAPTAATVARYLAEANASPELVSELVELSQSSDGPLWVAVDMPDQRRQLTALLEAEQAAQTVTAVAPSLVPGLLQTADYARSIMVSAKVPAMEIETRVAIRLGRQNTVMRQRDPVHLVALIGAGLLRQRIGGTGVMVEQLRALLEVAERPNIDIRVIPDELGWHPALEGPFVLVEFADRSPVVQLENRRSALFFHEGDDVAAYQEAADMVQEVALSPAASSELIAAAVKELETT